MVQVKITLEIPLSDYGRLATSAALQGLEVNRWVRGKCVEAARLGELMAVASRSENHPEKEVKREQG